MRHAVLWAAVMWLSGCSRCAPPPAVDAGIDAGLVATATDGGPQKVGSIDLRTALFTVFPEFRFVVLTSGRAVVERRIRWQPPEGTTLVEAITPWAEQRGFVRADGGHDFSRPPFALDVEPGKDGEVRLLVGLPIGQADVGKLLQSPAPLSAEELANWIPRPPDAQLVEETFTFAISYQGIDEERTAFLVRQMVDILLAGEWRVEQFPEGWEPDRRPDGGVGGVPTEFELTAYRLHANTRVEVKRKNAQAAVTLIQPIWR